MNRMNRILSAAILALGLAATAAPALAQGGKNPNDDLFKEEEPQESPSTSTPGYVGTLFFAAATIFAVCKSSRRS